MSGGGGGGSTTTSSTGYTPGMQALVEDELRRASIRTKARQADPTLAVAALDPRQAAALNAQTALAQDAISGRGIYDTEAETMRMLSNLEGQKRASQYGTGSGGYGSARRERALQSAMADQGITFAQERQRVADLGVKNLGAAGTTLQKQAQAYLDAPDKASSDFFGYVTGAAPKETKSTTSGGGK